MHARIPDPENPTLSAGKRSAGVSVPFVLFDGFIEARYHHVNQDIGSMAFVPITVGVMF